MQRILAAALVAGALAASAAPALAQYGPPPPGDAHDWSHHDDQDHHDDHGGWGHHDDHAGGWAFDQRVDWLRQRIDRGQADGSLDRHESRRVHRELEQIVHDERSYLYVDHGRLTDRHQFYIQEKLNRLTDQIRWLRANDDERRPW